MKGLEDKLRNGEITRKEFLRLTSTAAIGSLFFFSCSDQPVGPDPGPEPKPEPKTHLDLQLINAETGENSPGYIILDGNKEYRSDGRFDLTLTGNKEYTIQSGLSEGEDPQSYVRTIRINPTNQLNKYF